MYGQSTPFRPGGGGGRGRGVAQPTPQQQQQIHLNPNLFTNPNFFMFQQNPALLPHFNPFLQNPHGFPQIQQQFSNAFPVQMNSDNVTYQTPHLNGNDSSKFPQQQVKVQNEMIDKMDKAAKRARANLLASNENVSPWKVSQAALLMVKAESWESLGFHMQQVPSLNSLLVTEGKINAFIHCFVAVRKVTSLHDLEVEICESEGIERFEELGLGPLVRHPLTIHYFSTTSDVTEVCKITTEEIVSSLCEFIDTQKKKEVKVDTFLDFICKKKSVDGREKLCVRIQSFREYINHIKQARHSENRVLVNIYDTISVGSKKMSKRRPLFSAQKKEMDDQFTAIIERMKSFSPVNTQFCGKHTRFVSSSSEDDDSEASEDDDNQDKMNMDDNCSSSLSKVKSERVGGCPYPSATEERKRLRLKSEVDSSPSTSDGVAGCNTDNELTGRKRKLEHLSSSTSLPRKLNKRFLLDPNGRHNNSDVQGISGDSLSIESLKKFITTWQDTCQGNSAYEVLEMMLQFYKTRKKRKVKELFTLYPFVGLLYAAVTCIKHGLWDNVCETFMDSLTDVDTKPLQNSDDFITIDVGPAKEIVTSSASEMLTHQPDFTAEEIAKKISGYFEDDISRCNNSARENKIHFMRKICKCESWLMEQYAVSSFEFLGYGEYFMFLDKYMHLLPLALQKRLIGDISENVSLGAHLLPIQLDTILSQALHGLCDNEVINMRKVSEVLARQFPLVSFKLVNTDMANVSDILREKSCSLTSGGVLFSTSLFRLNDADSSAQIEKKTSGFAYNTVAREGMFATVTTKDAIEVLLKAPMLADLSLWSHWDILFAPSLGSIVEWLLKEVNTKELLCLVTKDGKVIRVDHSATIDSFLKVFMQGSSFEIAVELLSLFALYGGEQNVPLSLLKCHARQAFEVIINNYSEMELDNDKVPLRHGKSSFDRNIVGNSISNRFGSQLSNNKRALVNTAQVMSRFILDCLSYLPIEFCSFAADILIAGLQSFVKDVPSAILTECKRIDQRVMLHEVGITLGLTEWVHDYHSFSSSSMAEFSSGSLCLHVGNPDYNTNSMIGQGELDKDLSSAGEILVSCEVDCFRGKRVTGGADSMKDSLDCLGVNSERLSTLSGHIDSDSIKVIESIRQDEFGLDQSLSATENKMLQKQHARLGRALHCLSQELYSEDSHFLLELVQNADDNIYPENVEPTLTFILNENGVTVLNNEQGFSANNIRALCDVGNSTKKGHSAGYIGKKGIGFKSVFRVTDAPEIHSNGFHIKFDITQGQIGFVLPTIIPPCDIDQYTRLASADVDRMDQDSWKTCIVLPFRSKLSEGFSMNNILSMFSQLHPYLLLFLHRLQCIKFRNILDDSLTVMRKEVKGDGIVEVTTGNKKMRWFVVSQKLKADTIRSDVQTTEISLAFTLPEIDKGEHAPRQQPVFAFLPLRTYGLKFILQGDFVLPSSREEVDGNSPWNQWLLSAFPDLFVSAERLFCDLPFYRGSPGAAITTFMSFVPLLGEVQGFFASLPRMIISKLRLSNCLILEGDEMQWVPPCKVLRNWNDQARSLLPDSLLHEHLGLGFLNKDIVLSDSLAKALGLEDYGPKALLRVISSLCHSDNGLKSMGLSWLSSCLSALYVMSSQSPMQASPSFQTESDLIHDLQKTPFIPLLDGRYSSVNEDTIWLHSDGVGQGINDEFLLKAFPKLYAKLRIVSPKLLDAASPIECSASRSETSTVENLTRMLYKVGVQRLSAHDIVKIQILPAISDDNNAEGQEGLMIDYLAFVMFHLQSTCTNCSIERSDIIAELHKKALILTNCGYRRSNEVPIHFSQDYGNPVDVNKLIGGLGVKWHEIDTAYVMHPITKSISEGLSKWRVFLQEIGVTDFVQVVQVEKSVPGVALANLKDLVCGQDLISADSVIKNWESDELFQLISLLSSKDDGEKSKHLLEILDRLWDNNFSDKVTGYCIDSSGECKTFKSSLLHTIQDSSWVASNVDNKLHDPKDLFHDCIAVKSVLGTRAPYSIPKVRSEKLLADIGLKTEVTLDDALSVIELWRRSELPFKASVSQMANFYSFIWKEITSSKKLIEELHSGPFIFVPDSSNCSHEDVIPGSLLSPREVYWHDPIHSFNKIESSDYLACVTSTQSSPIRRMLCNFYPNLHNFFVNECGVDESPSFCSYLQTLLHLSTVSLPHQAAKRVFEVFLMWADALKSGLLSFEDIEYLKESLLKKEYTVLPTRNDIWVSLNPSFGLICWSDDDSLGKEFRHLEGVDFLYFGESADEENQMLQEKVSTIAQRLGIPILSEIVTREAIYYGPVDCSFIFSLLNWVLPYAQRYIYNAHRDKYHQLKQSDFESLRHLKIVVVERLFYRNVIKRCDITSKKRHECSCLLQGNILYCSRESDSHSVFLEFSRVLYSGTAELQFANFLHMITTMAESGATEEQTEFFILNSQKVPKLPADESNWSLQSAASSMESNSALPETCLSPDVEEQKNSSGFKRKPFINSNWPPADWKTAPGFNSASAFALKKTGVSSFHNTGGKEREQDNISPTQLTTEFDTELDHTAITEGSVLLEADFSDSQNKFSSNIVASGSNVGLDSVGLGAPDIKIFDFNNNDQAMAQLTGRLGELAAFRYFSENGGDVFVKWVNETTETGLPYDIFLGADEDSREYIEVKATKSGRKNWFLISMREWQFAIEKGESFSIAHVVLADNNMARITIYKNPARLCQLGNMKLALVVPKQ